MITPKGIYILTCLKSAVVKATPRKKIKKVNFSFISINLILKDDIKYGNAKIWIMDDNETKNWWKDETDITGVNIKYKILEINPYCIGIENVSVPIVPKRIVFNLLYPSIWTNASNKKLCMARKLKIQNIIITDRSLKLIFLMLDNKINIIKMLIKNVVVLKKNKTNRITSIFIKDNNE